MDFQVCCHFRIAFKPLGAVFASELISMCSDMLSQLHIVTELFLTKDTHMAFLIQLGTLNAMDTMKMIHDVHP